MVDYEFVAEAVRTFNEEFKVEMWNKFCEKELHSNRAKIWKNDKEYFSRFMGADDDPMWLVKALTDSEAYTYKQYWVNMDCDYYDNPTFHSADDPTELMGIDGTLYDDFLHYVADEMFE